MLGVFLKPRHWQIVYSEEHERRMWALLTPEGDVEEIDERREVPPSDDPYASCEPFE